jgi:hypothetical protein
VLIIVRRTMTTFVKVLWLSLQRVRERRDQLVVLAIRIADKIFSTSLKDVPQGAIAQLGERIVRNDEVVGSIPTSSTNPFNNFQSCFQAVQAIAAIAIFVRCLVTYC